MSHVRVDPDTGAVTLLGHVVAQDVGRALNPALVEGQMRGGTTQGLGLSVPERQGALSRCGMRKSCTPKVRLF